MLQNRIRKKQLDYTWPGFVDALSSILMVIIFVLMIFVVGIISTLELLGLNLFS